MILDYHLFNALRSMRKNPILTALMIAATAAGISVSMTMITIYYLMAQNPIPAFSEQLYRIQLDSWDPLRPFDADRPERAPIQLTYLDAVALKARAPALHQTPSFEANFIIEPEGLDQLPFEVSARVVYNDFFSMFRIPFNFGGPWSEEADETAQQVVILSEATNVKLFGGEDSTGEKIKINERLFTVVGVLDTYEPMPRFYDIVQGPVDDVSDIMIPFTLTPVMEINSTGSDYGWKSETITSFSDWLNSEACWLQYWAELPGSGDAEAYLNHLDNYVMEQKTIGRFQRPLNNHIHTVTEWLDYNEVVMPEVRLMVGIGLLFLLVCLLSSMSLLLTKFTTRLPEVCLRRALGANRRVILTQQLVEIALIGIIGGIIGVGLTQLSLSGMQASISRAPAILFQMNWTLIGIAILLSSVASLIAGLYPAWRCCLVEPASQLKTQ